MAKPRIGGIILAAGSSQRFGDDKRKAVLANGEMVIVNTIRKVASCLDSVIVVLRFGDKAFANDLEGIIDNHQVVYFLAPDSARGMAHSLANAIHRARDLDGAALFLADMPFIDTATVQMLVNTFEAHHHEQPIVAPAINGTPGHPVIFHRAYFDEIEALEGDRGARPVVDAHQDRLIEVEVSDAGIIQDIDTPDDLGQGASTR